MDVNGVFGRVRIALTLVAFGIGGPADAGGASAPAAAAPAVVLSETAITGGLALADVGHPDVSIPLHWVEKSGKTVQLRLEVTPLVNGRGDSVQPSFASGAASAPDVMTLEPRGMQRVTLKARLLDAGTYRALLRATVVDAGKQTRLDPIPITVTRTHVLPAVEFATASARQLEAPWFARLLAASAPLAAYTAGSAITLPVPHLAQASRKLAVDAAEGTATTLKLSPPADGAAPVRVEPGRQTPLTLAFTNIAGPGRYDATVRFVAEGYKPLDAKVVMFVREPATLALFFVFLGVLISFVIQLWGTAIRPARELRQRVAALMEPVAAARQQAGAAADPEVQHLLNGVEDGLQQRASATWYERPRIAASLDVYDAIVAALKPWISAWLQLDEVQPESVRAAYRTTLLDVRQQFVTRSPDAVQVATSVRSLELLPEKIRADVAAALGTAIDELDKSIAGDPRAGMVTLRARLRSAAGRLAGGQVEAAIGVYQQALRDYTVDMANLLRQRVDPAAPVPPGLDPAEWQALKKETLEALDASGPQDVDAALARLRQATAVYVQGFAAGLRRAMAKKPPAERQTVDDAAQKVDLAVDKHDLVGAWAALAEVQDAYAQAQALVGQPMGDARLGALVAATRAPGGTLDAQAGFDLPGWWAGLSQPGVAAKLGRRTLWGDLAVSLVVLVLAGLTGVQTLWVPNPVWGGPTAYLAALLLGFAADRFTQAAVAAFRR